MSVPITELSEGGNYLSLLESQQSPVIQDALIDAQRAYYSLFYETNVSDTTPESRKSIITRLNHAIPTLRPGAVILNLGSGRQPLEAEHIEEFGIPGIVYNKNGDYVHAYNFLTVDHTPLRSEQLLAHAAPHVTHLEGSGDRLDMIPDESIDVAISNLALDFMPREALAELYRVLVPGGKAFLNLSDPRSVIPSNLDDSFEQMAHKMYGNKWKRKRPQKNEDKRILLMLRNKRMLRDAKSLFENDEQIRTAFTSYGFSLPDVISCSQEDTDGWRMDWFEVDVQKPTEHDRAVETFEKKLTDALGFDQHDFAGSARTLYTHYLESNEVIARQSIAARAVAAWNPENEDAYKPEPKVLLEGSVRFAAKGAQAVGRESAHWWLHIALGLVSAERPVEQNGVLKLLPVASDGRVHGNRNTRDQIMTLYGEILDSYLDK